MEVEAKESGWDRVAGLGVVRVQPAGLGVWERRGRVEVGATGTAGATRASLVLSGLATRTAVVGRREGEVTVSEAGADG